MSFRTTRIIVTTFISSMVAVALSTNKPYLAICGIGIGVLFLSIVRRRVSEVMVDERVLEISGLASRLTYVIVTATLSLLSLVFIFAGKHSGQSTMEALGTVFAYIACLSLAVYSVSYKYYNRKYGGEN